ncbi:MAG: DUF2207 domain-containing protein [Mogibacterium sp.]|nr:DUF2207 domain-containing protein [Mogibacterium sp.]
MFGWRIMRMEHTGKLKKINRILAVFGILMLVLTVCGQAAFDSFADTNNKADDAVSKGTINGAVEIASFKMEATVEKSHAISVIEKIAVNLPDATSSIDFLIPNGNFRVKNVRVENTDYQSKTGSDISRVTIIDPDKLTKGTHVYTIEYVIKEFADRDESRDVFYFDAMLPGWEQPVSKVYIKVRFPNDFQLDDLQCYAGQYGVQSVDSKIDVNVDQTRHEAVVRGDRIPDNFGISFQTELPDGYWKGALDGAWALWTIMVIMAAVAAAMAVMWFIGGRDPKFDKLIQDHPVEGVNPAEISYIFTGRIHTRDLVGLVVYMATKGYLKISEYEPRRYCLIRENYPDGEEKFIRNAYDILFEDIAENRSLDMSQIGRRLRRIEKSIKDDVASGFSSKEMSSCTPLSKILRYVSIGFYSVAMSMSCVLRYEYQYLDYDLAEAIIVFIAAAFTAVVFIIQVDRQNYSETKADRMTVILSSILFLTVPIYVAIQIAQSTGSIIVAAAEFLLAVVCGFLITIMRARGKGNAALVNRLIQLRDFIYHPSAKEVIMNYSADPNYYYDMVPYALLFEGLETWAISFLTLNVPEPEWYSADIEGHAHYNIRVNPTSVDYAKDIKTFYRTIIDAYRSMVRRRK